MLFVPTLRTAVGCCGDFTEIEFNQPRVVAVGAFAGGLQDFGSETTGQLAPLAGRQTFQFGIESLQIGRDIGPPAGGISGRGGRVTLAGTTAATGLLG